MKNKINGTSRRWAVFLLAAGLCSAVVFRDAWSDSSRAPESAAHSFLSEPLPGRCGVTSFHGSYGVSFQGEREETPCAFGFDNTGGNTIVPEHIRPGATYQEWPSRSWNFDFEGLDFQHTYLWITDALWETTSSFQTSLLYFFPMKQTATITPHDDGKTLAVMLPNTEMVFYDSVTKTIIGGVLGEKPVWQPAPGVKFDRFKSKPAGISYTGFGIMLKADARATDPRLRTGGYATFYSRALKPCRVKVESLWVQEDLPRVLLKMKNNCEVDALLRKQCGYGMPGLAESECTAIPAQQNPGNEHPQNSQQ